MNMDNLDGSENNAKISDSAYSNSCSNSQSRRSQSSKSTHSSGSSGYGGKPPAYSEHSSTAQAEKRGKEKDGKKKKLVQTENPVQPLVKTEEISLESTPPPGAEVEVITDNRAPLVFKVHTEKRSENMDISTPDRDSSKDEDGFSCVISMHDGVVMYTTTSLTTALGFPKDMWVGRSFIDFVHPRDRDIFTSHISSGLAVPKNLNGTVEVVAPAISVCTMVCRIRRYRNLSSGFGVKERTVAFVPFLLKLSFKHICDEDDKVTYLVIQATPFFSAFRRPNEIVLKPVPFVIRHAASGTLEYIDPESVPYLGYLPQDLVGKDALQLYHPEDLPYLRQVYESIVKEGGSTKSKSYRMIAQNGDFIKVETEWSSFINPWSRKLEFVIGKHHILEGPSNPDVFQAQDKEKAQKMNEEDKNKARELRENIYRILNEALTKPAEVAKQQMTKRCQDLAAFMESLMEGQPKTEEELRLEIQDSDHSYYERDSVLLGGISPHHDNSDSNSGPQTPLSYNQLNYNETLQRYFNSHQSNSFEDRNIVNEEIDTGYCVSSLAQNSDNSKITSCTWGTIFGTSSSPAPMGDYLHIRLTESLLIKHNAEMEKELKKIHRQTNSSYKGERVRETRQKKKEHIARCNAVFQSTSEVNTAPETPQPHGVKRSSKKLDSELVLHKHHCPSPRQFRRRLSTGFAAAQSSAAIATTVVQCTMYGQAVYCTPFMFSPTNNQISYPLQPSVVTQTQMYTNTTNHALELTTSNYEEACKPSLPLKTNIQLVSHWREKKIKNQGNSSKSEHGSGESNSSSNALNMSMESVPNVTQSRNGKKNNSDESVERTDGESSYSSFYSSFFKTESGSADDSGDAKKAANQFTHAASSNNIYENDQMKIIGRRKSQPPWMEQVCLTSELVYKYQILTKSKEQVLQADKLKMLSLEQPSLVNEQLGQLYVDFQLEGVAARLTLEEGITSSSSSGEETITGVKKVRRKRQYSTLGMIYEEDAPLPPSPENSPAPCESTP